MPRSPFVPIRRPRRPHPGKSSLATRLHPDFPADGATADQIEPLASPVDPPCEASTLLSSLPQPVGCCGPSCRLHFPYPSTLPPLCPRGGRRRRVRVGVTLGVGAVEAAPERPRVGGGSTDAIGCVSAGGRGREAPTHGARGRRCSGSCATAAVVGDDAFFLYRHGWQGKERTAILMHTSRQQPEKDG